MNILKTVAVAFSMYSRLPMPNVTWSETNMRYALCAFPLVGLVQGVLAIVWGLAASHFGIAPVLVAAVFTVLPVAVNGGIHLDGLCDTADALASHADRERKLEILKDPHIGAFGVLGLICHMLLLFGLFWAFRYGQWSCLWSLPCLYLISRALSGFAIIWFPGAKRDGTAHSFSSASAGNRAALILAAVAVAGAVGLIWLQGLPGIFAIVGAALVLLYYRYMAIKEFGGVTGDLAGWFLQTAELVMLFILVIGGMVL